MTTFSSAAAGAAAHNIPANSAAAARNATGFIDSTVHIQGLPRCVVEARDLAHTQRGQLEHYDRDLSKGFGLGHAPSDEESTQQNMVSPRQECPLVKLPQFAACADAHPITDGADQSLRRSVGSFWYISAATRRSVQCGREFWEWGG